MTPTQQIAALTEALTLAANRLQKTSIDAQTGSLAFIERGEWADEARATLAAVQDLCEDEGCPHHGTPHVCVNNATAVPDFPDWVCKDCGRKQPWGVARCDCRG